MANDDYGAFRRIEILLSLNAIQNHNNFTLLATLNGHLAGQGIAGDPEAQRAYATYIKQLNDQTAGGKVLLTHSLESLKTMRAKVKEAELEEKEEILAEIEAEAAKPSVGFKPPPKG